ncbi:MAG TPA: dihydrolipoyllysine-residue acetyltransferase [Streptosporangiaceae bacterium]|jgi:pyruvate dehydrogenase E2 component (dihydrolipoamide acetyltransferase)|nr:dihydrolipoyllysine-residue acetyltransferase [Streptosporangiaceae bacterium]
MTTPTEVRVPDIGNFADVPIIEVHVKAGDRVNEEDPLITLESDKATMDVPSPLSGQVRDIAVKVGDQVSKGTLILTAEPGAGAVAAPPTLVEQQEPEVPATAPPAREPGPPVTTEPAAVPVHAEKPAAPARDFTGVHASPSVRRAARELGVNLTAVTGTGPKGRITKDDLLSYLHRPAPAAAVPAAAAAGIPEIPAQDFSQFGPVQVRPLSRIKKLSGPHLHRSWLNIPHVTQHDEADITTLDAYRRELDTSARADGYRVTLLAFLMKAAVSALKQFPEVNSSLSPEKDSLILKSYYHLGVAVDTPDGLVVPVIRDVDRKGITELSKELGAVSAKAREGKLSVTGMQGGTFTISSLGGIGGTAFTPVVNAPEVAILGVVRSKMTPVWNGGEFAPRLMLPLSLSYDHRVIDGALAARFTRHLCHLLEDPRRLLL